MLKAELLMENYDCLNWRRERLYMLSTQMRRRRGGGEGGGVIWGEYWRWNCWMEMEEKQNEREILREAQLKPHVHLIKAIYISLWKTLIYW